MCDLQSICACLTRALLARNAAKFLAWSRQATARGDEPNKLSELTPDHICVHSRLCLRAQVCTMSGLLGLLERQGRQALCSTTGRSFATAAAQVFERDVSPILGEVSKTAMSSGRSFWLDVDQKIVPEQYRYDSLPSHVKELPILFAAFRKTLAVPEQGTWASKQLRGSGFVPALLDSLPHKQAPQRLVVPVAQITTAFEQFGATFTNALFLLQIVPMDDLAAFNMPAEDYAAIVAKGWKPTPLHTFQVRLQPRPYPAWGLPPSAVPPLSGPLAAGPTAAAELQPRAERTTGAHVLEQPEHAHRGEPRASDCGERRRVAVRQKGGLCVGDAQGGASAVTRDQCAALHRDRLRDL